MLVGGENRMPLQHDQGLAELLANTVFSDKAAIVVATGMISSPLWLQYLKVVSDVAALLAPILGCIYLLLQIGARLKGKKTDG